jgi:hypothetical protein
MLVVRNFRLLYVENSTWSKFVPIKTTHVDGYLTDININIYHSYCYHEINWKSEERKFDSTVLLITALWIERNMYVPQF